MGEQIPTKNHEQIERHQITPEFKSDYLETSSEKLPKEESERSSKVIESAREVIEKRAISSEVPIIEKQAEQPDHAIHYATKQIKNERYKTTLTHIRRHLSPTQKVLSKIVHQPTVEAMSEIGAKTIARPSGLLGGGLVALIASLTIIIIARRVGFVVPNSIFAMTFVGGFCLGIAAEAILRVIKRPRKHLRVR